MRKDILIIACFLLVFAGFASSTLIRYATYAELPIKYVVGPNLLDGRNSPLILRTDSNDLMVFMKDGNFYRLKSGKTVFDLNANLANTTTTPGLNHALTRTPNNKLFASGFIAATNAIFVTTCKNGSLDCNRAIDWNGGGVTPNLENGNKTGMDSNASNWVFAWKYTAPHFKGCNANIKDCNTSANWVTLGDATSVGVEANNPIISARGQYVYAFTSQTNNAGVIVQYNASANTVTSLNNGIVANTREAAIAVDSNGNAYVAFNDWDTTKRLYVAKYVANPFSLSTVWDFSDTNLTRVSLSMRNDVAYLMVDANLPGSNGKLSYAVKSLTDSNFSNFIFVQSNCQQHTAAKEFTLGYLDYTCWNSTTQTVDSNFLYSPYGTVSADFNYSYRSGIDYLDQELGLNSVIVDFNDLSIDMNSVINDWDWSLNGTLFGSDQNEVYAFTSAGDYNITLTITDTNGNTSSTTKTVSVIQAASGLSISWTVNDINSFIDVNFSYTSSYGDANSQTWRRWVNGDLNQQGVFVGMRSIFGVDGNIFVCINANFLDYNKQKCQSFYSTIILVKRPLDEADLNIIIPFQITVSGNFSQDHNRILADRNVFLFDFGNASFLINGHHPDKAYYSRTYNIDENTSNTNRTLQPYLVPITNGLNPTLVFYNSLTKNTIANVSLSVKKQIGANLIEILSLKTDDKGEAIGSFTYNNLYYFDVTYGNYYKRFEVRPLSSTTIQFFLDLNGTLDWNISPFKSVDVNYYAHGLLITGDILTGSPYDFNVGVPTLIYFTISNITVTVSQNGKVLQTCTDNAAPFQCNFSFDATQTAPIMVETKILTSLGMVVKVKYFRTSGAIDRTQFLKDLSKDWGTAGTMLLSLIIIFFIIAFMHQKITDNYDALGLVTAILLGFFVYLTWMPIEYFLFALLIAIFLGIRRFI